MLKLNLRTQHFGGPWKYVAFLPVMGILKDVARPFTIMKPQEAETRICL